MVRSIRELLYDQGFISSSARNKLQEPVQGERGKQCLENVMPDAIDGPDDVNTSFQRLEEVVELKYGKEAILHFSLVRQELFEIRDLLSEVLYAQAIIRSLIGVWRSLVAHLHGVQGVEGSNPFTPTI